MPEHESSALVELLRAAWEHGVGFGMGSQEPSAHESDAAFLAWLHEHAGEVASMLAQFAEQVTSAERTRLAQSVRALQGPMAWRRFKMAHRLMNPAPSADLPRLVRAISDEIADGWRAS